MKKTIAGVFLVVVLGGCSDPTPRENRSLDVEGQSGRMRVASAQVIRDAKGVRRDILVLEDTKTGVEYVAVMGAGVTETKQSHSSKNQGGAR